MKSLCPSIKKEEIRNHRGHLLKKEILSKKRSEIRYYGVRGMAFVAEAVDADVIVDIHESRYWLEAFPRGTS